MVFHRRVSPESRYGKFTTKSQNKLYESATSFSSTAISDDGFSCQLTRVWQADTAEDGGSHQVWLARVVVWQGMRAPGRRVGLCRRSTRLGAPGAAPSHPVLAVRPSCGLLKCSTVSFVSHRHTAIIASRFQLLLYHFTITIELLPHRNIGDILGICHSRSQLEGTPLTPLLK